jgi:hypothetical protein
VIKIGISCATPRDGIVREYCVAAEIRNCVEDGTPALIDMFKFCMANDIYAIVNIDLWTSKGHLKYNEADWRQRVDGLVSELLQIEPTATKWRITIDNEPMKYMTKEGYGWLVNIAYDQIKIKRRWNVKIGAGNEEFSLAAARGDMYLYILNNCKFDYIDIHFQAAVINPASKRVNDALLNHWGDTAKQWATTYNKKLSCTEANWCNVSTANGYLDLKKIINKAEEIGCEDLCIVFLDYRGSDYRWLCFNVNGTQISFYWTDMLQIIKDKKPIIIEDEDMELERVYYENRKPSLIFRDKKGYGIMFLRKCFGLSHSAVFDQALTNKVKEYQQVNHLLVDGIVGPETFGNMILVEDYYKHYCWVHSLWARELVY